MKNMAHILEHGEAPAEGLEVVLERVLDGQRVLARLAHHRRLQPPRLQPRTHGSGKPAHSRCAAQDSRQALTSSIRLHLLRVRVSPVLSIATGTLMAYLPFLSSPHTHHQYAQRAVKLHGMPAASGGTFSSRDLAGGCGLQELSVNWKSAHLRPARLHAASSSGMYSAGSDASLRARPHDKSHRRHLTKCSLFAAKWRLGTSMYHPYWTCLTNFINISWWLVSCNHRAKPLRLLSHKLASKPKAQNPRNGRVWCSTSGVDSRAFPALVSVTMD